MTDSTSDSKNPAGDLASGFKDIEFIFSSRLKYSSENATCGTFRDAIRQITEDIRDISPDAVLVLHGTDTMSFSRSLQSDACLIWAFHLS